MIVLIFFNKDIFSFKISIIVSPPNPDIMIVSTSSLIVFIPSPSFISILSSKLYNFIFFLAPSKGPSLTSDAITFTLSFVFTRKILNKA